MVQMGVDLDLSSHLPNHLGVYELLNRQYFQGHNVLGCFLSGQVDMTESILIHIILPATKGPSYLKSAQVPLLWIK